MFKIKILFTNFASQYEERLCMDIQFFEHSEGCFHKISLWVSTIKFLWTSLPWHGVVTSVATAEHINIVQRRRRTGARLATQEHNLKINFHLLGNNLGFETLEARAGGGRGHKLKWGLPGWGWSPEVELSRVATRPWQAAGRCGRR